MKNEYDNEEFFAQYAQMSRSKQGLAAAGEWHQLEPLFPPLEGKSLLDLGCGYGWHCDYAAEHGASTVLGIDLSEKMIAQAKLSQKSDKITYQVCGLDEYAFPQKEWDCVVSNLVLHYVEDLEQIFNKIFHTLKPDGTFLFNIEHPIFTAGVGQDWAYDSDHKPLYWPVDNYFMSGERKTHFLGCDVIKQHHTLTQILGSLLNCGFIIERVEEVTPPDEMMGIPGMADELRRPMMLLVKAKVSTK